MVLVEGAGGLLSPLTWELSLLELMTPWQAKAVVVAGDRLGCISHSRLVLRALGDTPVLALVLSTGERQDLSQTSNHRSLERLEPEVELIRLPFLRDPGQEASAYLEALASRIVHELG